MKKKRVTRQEARRRFHRLVPVERSAPGDRTILDSVDVLNVDGEEAYVEIRPCGAPLGANRDIPAVSAIDYRCCVVWAGKRNCWYVFSPDELVRLAAAKKTRGRTDAIPFESTSIAIGTGIVDPDKPQPRPAYPDADLAEAVFLAIRRGRHRAEKILMNRLQKEIDADEEPQILRTTYCEAARKMPKSRNEYKTLYSKMLSENNWDDATLLACDAIAETLSEDEIADAERIANVLRSLDKRVE